MVSCILNRFGAHGAFLNYKFINTKLQHLLSTEDFTVHLFDDVVCENYLPLVKWCTKYRKRKQIIILTQQREKMVKNCVRYENNGTCILTFD